MRTFEIEKGQDLIQKQKSYSTSSFYRPRSQTKMIIKNNSQIGVRIEHEERQIQQQIQKIKLAINFKIEYVEKRQNETLQDNQKNIRQIIQFEKNMTQKFKNIQRNDRTKEWTLEMERSIQSIMSNNKEGNKKNYEKSLVDCKKHETKYNQLDDRVRQQKKQREKEWEELIDNVGETIIEAEELIEEQRYNMEVTISEIESKVLDIEQYATLCLQQQKNKRKQEHEYLTKLIERIMDKLLH